MDAEKSSASGEKLIVEFRQAAEKIIARFRDAEIPRAKDAAKELKGASQCLPKKARANALAEYFGKLRDILIAETIYADLRNDSGVLVRMGGPLDEEGRPLTEDRAPQGEFFMFDTIDSLRECADILFSKRRKRREALADSYFLIRELVAQKYAHGELDSYDAEAELDAAASGLLPSKKGPVRALAESWRREIVSDIAAVKAGARADGTMSETAEKAAFDLHKRFNALSNGPEEPTKGYKDLFMAARDAEEGPACHLNGSLLIMESVTDQAGQPCVVLGSQFGTAGEVLKVVRQKYPENDSPLTDAYRRKYEESLGALIPEEGAVRD